jgi:hypothetical protein
MVGFLKQKRMKEELMNIAGIIILWALIDYKRKEPLTLFEVVCIGFILWAAVLLVNV